MASMATDCIVALDNMGFQAADTLMQQLQGLILGSKGNDLLDGEESPKRVVQHFSKYGEFFADIKAHDTPDTVGNRVARYASYGATFITVHGSGGPEMIKKAVRAYERNGRAGSGVLVVTVLTSIDPKTCHQIYRRLPQLQTALFCKWAAEAGAYGVICSPLDIAIAKKAGIEAVTPGIRLPGAKVHDQKRIDTPYDAFNRGAHRIVVGRPITEAPDPREAIRSFDQNIARVVS